MIYKCKICGGDIELNNDKGIGTCLYCGSTMTFPKITDEQRISSYNRGNHFRRLGEFDQALTVYEQIIKEDESDAEAHWCAALCRYGIEYVEDPATMEYIPTCHRASFDNFTEDIDYQAAIKYSDGVTQRQYQKDGKKIEDVQKAILATSSKEDPFDIFICYKESDENGGRTHDSVLAQDIYDQLTEKGYKVFFSRITLEEKVGSEYEPYIFAALNSAKVMIVVGTSKEHLDAVWVKNEWSRFLSMMKKDRSKVLLPCYKDMNPYDMPEALSVLQSYNMAAIGFRQDLLHGISKILELKTRGTADNKSIDEEIKPLLKRVFLFLEEGKFKDADVYAEKVLDKDPENAEAYVGKLMSSLRITRRDHLGKYVGDLSGFDSYNNALRFAKDEFHKELVQYNETAKAAKIEKQKSLKRGFIIGIVVTVLLSAIIACIYIVRVKVVIPKEKYEEAVLLQNNKQFNEAISVYQELGDYKDCVTRISQCQDLYAEEEKERVEKDRRLRIQNIKDEEVGASLFFGTYEMDGNLENGNESIEWIVVAHDDDKTLLLSKYALKEMPFDESGDDSTKWMTSSVREWLNGQFYDNAFDYYEKECVVLSRVAAYTNNISSDEDTDDRVFILSAAAAEYLYSIDAGEFSKCQPSEKERLESETGDAEQFCEWWVRTPASLVGYIQFMSNSGQLYYRGKPAGSSGVYIRPALWISAP